MLCTYLHLFPTAGTLSLMSAASPRPRSLIIAATGTAVAGVFILLVALGSLLQPHAGFSLGIGAILIVYGAAVCAGAWLAWRRSPFSWGLVVAPGLLHTAVALSLLTAGDLPQAVGAGVALLLFLTTLVAALWPSTRVALRRHGGSGELS